MIPKPSTFKTAKNLTIKTKLQLNLSANVLIVTELIIKISRKSKCQPLRNTYHSTGTLLILIILLIIMVKVIIVKTEFRFAHRNARPFSLIYLVSVCTAWMHNLKTMIKS